MVNEWTSNDVPSVSSLNLYNRRPDLDLDGKRFGAAAALEAVVEHLNAHYLKPENPEQLLRMCNEADLKRTRAEADADRWRRAHEIVEGERDLARERLREVDTALAKCMSDYQDVEDDRDEWKARAEAAEARTAPAVTKAEIEKAIRGKVWAANREPNKAGFHRVHVDWATDAIHALVAGDDPAVLVVRESDLPEVERDEDGDWLCENLVVNRRDTAEELRGRALSQLKHVAMREAVARAIEAGQAADPLLDKAQEFAALADWELTEREARLLHTVARHVLG